MPAKGNWRRPMRVGDLVMDMSRPMFGVGLVEKFLWFDREALFSVAFESKRLSPRHLMATNFRMDCSDSSLTRLEPEEGDSMAAAFPRYELGETVRALLPGNLEYLDTKICDRFIGWLPHGEPAVVYRLHRAGRFVTLAPEVSVMRTTSQELTNAWRKKTSGNGRSRDGQARRVRRARSDYWYRNSRRPESSAYTSAV